MSGKLREEFRGITQPCALTLYLLKTSLCLALSFDSLHASKSLVVYKAGWCKTGLSEQGYGSYVVHAHLGREFLFLDLLAVYTLLSLTVMVTPCLWYVVGMKLGHTPTGVL